MANNKYQTVEEVKSLALAYICMIPYFSGLVHLVKKLLKNIMIIIFCF